MLIFLLIMAYIVCGIMWCLVSIMFGPDDVALCFYESTYKKDRVDYGWLVVNIMFWPFAIIGVVTWFVVMSIGWVMKKLLDKRYK